MSKKTKDKLNDANTEDSEAFYFILPPFEDLDEEGNYIGKEDIFKIQKKHEKGSNNKRI